VRNYYFFLKQGNIGAGRAAHVVRAPAWQGNIRYGSPHSDYLGRGKQEQNEWEPTVDINLGYITILGWDSRFMGIIS
jgi:hypothetical protein